MQKEEQEVFEKTYVKENNSTVTLIRNEHKSHDDGSTEIVFDYVAMNERQIAKTAMSNSKRSPIRLYQF